MVNQSLFCIVLIAILLFNFYFFTFWLSLFLFEESYLKNTIIITGFGCFNICFWWNLQNFMIFSFGVRTCHLNCPIVSIYSDIFFRTPGNSIATFTSLSVVVMSEKGFFLQITLKAQRSPFA